MLKFDPRRAETPSAVYVLQRRNGERSYLILHSVLRRKTIEFRSLRILKKFAADFNLKRTLRDATNCVQVVHYKVRSSPAESVLRPFTR